MHTGELYYPNEESIFDEQLKKLDLLYEFNSARQTEQKRRQALMKEMLAEVGENCYLEPPFHANWGGAHMHLGDSVYANFNFTAVDDSHIYIGSHTMIGPNVTVATAGHPILPELREKAYQFNMPVRIGENCWIGAGGSDNARRDDRGQQRYRRGQRRYERYSGECRGLRQSLPRREGDKRARPRILLQRQTNHERDF
jgi:hypothetical protein